MPSDASNEVQLSFQIAPEFKRTIEDAAAYLGQSVSDFATSTLMQSARAVIQQRTVTELSGRDRDVFVALVDDEAAEPNPALKRAVERSRR